MSTINLIKQNIDYENRGGYNITREEDKKLYGELFSMICDVVCVPRKYIKVNGEDCPYEKVKSKFLKLTSEHMGYVINSMNGVTSKVRNVRAHMITVLYNSVDTIEHYRQYKANMGKAARESVSKNQFNSFEQYGYDISEEFEKEILSN